MNDDFKMFSNYERIPMNDRNFMATISWVLGSKFKKKIFTCFEILIVNYLTAIFTRGGRVWGLIADNNFHFKCIHTERKHKSEYEVAVIYIYIYIYIRFCKFEWPNANNVYRSILSTKSLVQRTYFPSQASLNSWSTTQIGIPMTTKITFTRNTKLQPRYYPYDAC